MFSFYPSAMTSSPAASTVTPLQNCHLCAELSQLTHPLSLPEILAPSEHLYLHFLLLLETQQVQGELIPNSAPVSAWVGNLSHL